MVELFNLSKGEVYQWPKLGVKTKNCKHATTGLLRIPDLMGVIIKWDSEIRKELPLDSFWFAHIDTETLEFSGDDKVGKHRHARARKDLKEWVNRVGFKYYSPHKFRHGTAVYSLKRAKTIADLKAISMNLMHSDLRITDGIYAILSNVDVKNVMKRLGNRGRDAELIEILQTAIEELIQKK